MARLLASLLGLMLISACSGTGVKYDHSVAASIDSADSKIFIVRESAVIGSGVVLRVLVNGEAIGELGVGEVLSVPSQEGVNVIRVEGTGLSGVGPFGYKEGVYELTQSSSTNRYISVELDHSIFAFNHEIDIKELTAASWKAIAKE
jgi:hypothetical protein